MAYAILRTEKLKTTGNINALNGHLQRTRDTPNADAELTHQNELLRGSTDLMADIQARLDELKGSPRKNAVLAVEHLLTFSPDFVHFFKEDGNYSPRATADTTSWLVPESQVDIDRLNGFVDKALAWLDKRYGAENVVNVHLHLDETTPHLHATIVPVDERGKLNCRTFLGGRKLMTEMQTSFAEEMAPLGLVRGVEGSKAQHQDVKRFYALAKELGPGLASEVVQAKLQANEKERQKDPNQPLSATIHYHNEEVGAKMVKEFRTLDLRIMAINPAEQTVTVEYRTESPEIDKIHAYFGLVKEADNHIEESGAHFRQRGHAALERERTREQGLELG